MPTKKRELSSEDQRQRFEAEVERMVADGELNLIDAQKRLDNLVKGPVAEAARKR